MPEWHATGVGKSLAKKSAETLKPLRKDYKCNQVKRRKQTIKIVLSAKAEKASSSSSIKRRAKAAKRHSLASASTLSSWLPVPSSSTIACPCPAGAFFPIAG